MSSVVYHGKLTSMAITNKARAMLSLTAAERLEKKREWGRKAGKVYADRYPERAEASQRAYYWANREMILAKAKEYGRTHPETIKQRNLKQRDARYFSSIKKQFGVTREHYVRMFNEQGGVCAICKNACPSGRRFHLDHQHADNYETLGPIEKAALVRGLLCRACNVGVGFFRDNPTLLECAAAYLRGPRG